MAAPSSVVEAPKTSEEFLKENLELPIATVSRIIKNALPNNTQVAKDVKSLFSKAAGIFIIYLSTHANEICQERKKSTISAQDVLAAVKEIEMEDFLPSLEKYLEEFRHSNTKKRAKAKQPSPSPPGSSKKQKTS
uniref:Transcription factor CBF/NF-Y/archaeal histone domain-containing protein n=1 Tax=Lotharella globosa TaxID=91324 RepID=A0A6V3SUV3_9EUKA